MTLDELIERRAAEARLEIAILYRKALEELNRKVAFINRSRGQRARFARARQLRGEA